MLFASRVIKLTHSQAPDPWKWNLRKQLEDTQEELWALIREHSRDIDTGAVKNHRERPASFDYDIQLFLSTYKYDKIKLRRPPSLGLDESSWYTGLGILGDFTDDLKIFGFERQVSNDPANASYYYDCLAKIAGKKNSEMLSMKMAMLASEGYYGRDEVTAAYKYFGLDSRKAHELTDDYIRGVFEARVGSIAQSQEAEAREQLRMIGVARGSKALQDTASNGEFVSSLLSMLHLSLWNPGHDRSRILARSGFTVQNLLPGDNIYTPPGAHTSHANYPDNTHQK